MGFQEYDDYDATGLAELVRSGEVSALELVNEVEARVRAINPKINAVVRTMFEEAREVIEGGVGQGPFAGVPFLVKDLIQGYPGVPTTSGCRFTRDYLPEREGELLRRYRTSGLVVVGKTNTPELGVTPVTEPELHGPTRNPWDLQRTSGGSSGGSGAAVAAGVVPMAHGGDGGGSIRIPSACCGLFGLKPTRARNPMGPDSSEGWSGYVVEHVLSRSVRDSAGVLDVTAGPEPTSLYYAPSTARPFAQEVGAPPGTLKVGFTLKGAMPSKENPECRAAVEDVVGLLEELGHEVQEFDPKHDAESLAQAFFTVICGHVAADVRDLETQVGRKATVDEFEVQTWLLRMLGEQMSAADITASVRTLQAEARRLVSAYQAYDVILSPTLGAPPLEVGAIRASGAEAMLQSVIAKTGFSTALKLPGAVKQAAERAFDFVPYTPVANFTGQPSMNVPLHWNGAGLPIGTMFTGAFGDEATLIRLASQLEEARPWANRRPPHHAGASRESGEATSA